MVQPIASSVSPSWPPPLTSDQWGWRAQISCHCWASNSKKDKRKRPGPTKLGLFQFQADTNIYKPSMARPAPKLFGFSHFLCCMRSTSNCDRTATRDGQPIGHAQVQWQEESSLAIFQWRWSLEWAQVQPSLNPEPPHCLQSKAGGLMTCEIRNFK